MKFGYRIIHSRTNEPVYQSNNWDKTVRYLKELNGSDENKTYLILRTPIKEDIEETKDIIVELKGGKVKCQ